MYLIKHMSGLACNEEESSWLRCLTAPRYLRRVNVFTNSSSCPSIAPAVLTTEQAVNSSLKPASKLAKVSVLVWRLVFQEGRRLIMKAAKNLPSVKSIICWAGWLVSWSRLAQASTRPRQLFSSFLVAISACLNSSVPSETEIGNPISHTQDQIHTRPTDKGTRYKEDHRKGLD